MAMRSESVGLHVETASQNRTTDEIIKGKVGEVRQQFQIHEDTAFAYEIQSQEIKNHVSRNKEQRKSVRDNIKTAKQTYLEEVKNAGVLPKNSVEEIEQKQWLAEELHRRVEEQENVTKAKTDKQRCEDEEIALRVQQDEELQLRYLEHKRVERAEDEHKRLRKIMKDLETANLSDHSDNEQDSRHEHQREDDTVWQLPETKEIITLADGTVIDAKQNEVQTEEQKRQHMQKRDEELAKILQSQEDLQIEKQKHIHEDLRKAIELQDREIAKHLQRQEKAKAEKRREKVRRGQSLPERDELMSSNRRHLPTYHEAIGVDDVERETLHHNNAPYQPESERKTTSLEDRNAKKHHKKTHKDRQDEIWIPRDNNFGSDAAVESRGDQDDTGAHYNNIAETLDPTFQRIPQQSSSSLMDEYDSEQQTGSKTAQIVPPLKRKTSKDKSKRDKECKQQ